MYVNLDFLILFYFKWLICYNDVNNHPLRIATELQFR